MWKHNEEAIEAVEEFNEKLMSIIGDDRDFEAGHMMSMETNGDSTIIKFMGVVLWGNEVDERESEDEPLLEFLEKRAKEELERFSRVLLPKTEEGGTYL